MVDWVHCNKCLIQPTKSSAVEIQITNCGHLFCVKCMDPGQLNKCLVCHVECSSVPVSSSMNPDIGYFFKDTTDMLQKYLQVTEFQDTHRRRLFAQYSKELQIVQNKYAQAKEHIKKISKNLSTLEKENQAMKEHVNKVSRDVGKLQNDNQRLRNFIKMSAASPSPGVPPSCRGPLSSGGSNTSLFSRPNPPNSTNASLFGRPNPPNSTNADGSGLFMRAQAGSNTNLTNQSRISQTQKPDLTRKLFMTETQRPQLTPNRLILPRTSQYRTAEEFNDSTDKDSSYKRLSNFSLASGGAGGGDYSLPRFGSGLYASPLNMSGLSLNSKTSLPSRK